MMNTWELTMSKLSVRTGGTFVEGVKREIAFVLVDV